MFKQRPVLKHCACNRVRNINVYISFSHSKCRDAEVCARGVLCYAIIVTFSSYIITIIFYLL